MKVVSEEIIETPKKNASKSKSMILTKKDNVLLKS